jgi:hypothetical protein
VDKSLETLGNKVRKGLKKASSQHEKIEPQLREYTWHSLSPERPLFPAVHCLWLEIGSTFLKFLSGIMNDHGLVEVKESCHKNSMLSTGFWWQLM